MTEMNIAVSEEGFTPRALSNLLLAHTDADVRIRTADGDRPVTVAVRITEDRKTRITFIHGEVAITPSNRQSPDTSVPQAPAVEEILVLGSARGFVADHAIIFPVFDNAHVDVLFPGEYDSETVVPHLEVKPPGTDWTRVTHTELSKGGNRLVADVSPVIFHEPNVNSTETIQYRILL